MVIITIISHVPTAGTQVISYGLHIRSTGHNPPRGLSAGWRVLTTVNTAGTNGLTCLSKNGRTRDSKFLVTHPMTDQLRCCLTSAIARRSALTAGPSRIVYIVNFSYQMCLVTVRPTKGISNATQLLGLLLSLVT
jgi:hypothetical protein